MLVETQTNKQDLVIIKHFCVQFVINDEMRTFISDVVS